MSLQEIKIGNFANDGTGDDLREAFRKVNLNFQELDLRDDESTTAVNIGTVGEGLYAAKFGYELRFKKLVAGRDITLTGNDERILIDANGGLKSLLVLSDSGSAILEETAGLNVFGTNGIQTSMVDNTLTIDLVGPIDISTDTTPQLGGNLDSQGFDLTSVGNITASAITSGEIFGNFRGKIYDDTQTLIFDSITGSVNLSKSKINSLADVDDSPALTGYILKWNGTKWVPSPDTSDADNFDFNGIILNVSSISDYIAVQTEVDMGSIQNPNPIGIDMGTI